MPLISFKVGDLPLYLKHDFIPLGPGGRLVFVHECIYCNAVFDMPIRCRRAVPRAGKTRQELGRPFSHRRATH
jgi:hypothetical protein